jgi:acylphosphatase
MTVQLTAVVSGRVQGVGFRDWVRRQATALRLTGTATNLPDGRVEVVAQGARAACDQLLAVLSGDGAPGYVADVQASWSDEAGQLVGFRMR